MAHEAFKRRHLNASKFRGLCEIAREVYWSTKDLVVREKAMSFRWKAVQIDAELRKLSTLYNDRPLTSSIGKKERSSEVCHDITASRNRLFEEENHKGMLSEEYMNHLSSRDPNKTIHEVLRELYEVSGDERLLEAKHMATRMLLKISEYQKRRA